MARVRARCRRLSWVGGLRVFGPESWSHPPGLLSERRVPEKSREDRASQSLPKRPHLAPVSSLQDFPLTRPGDATVCDFVFRVLPKATSDVSHAAPACSGHGPPRGDRLPREPQGSSGDVTLQAGHGPVGSCSREGPFQAPWVHRADGATQLMHSECGTAPQACI